MIDIEHNLLPELKTKNMMAYLLSYIVWNSKFPHGDQFVSLIHQGWAYAIKGEIFDQFESDYPEAKQKLPYLAITDESLRFRYYKISLSQLPDDLVLTSQDREPCGFCYYPYANREQSFIIFSAFLGKDSEVESESDLE